MKTRRLLLPFTHGVHMGALRYAVLLAKSWDATLVPLAAIHVPERRRDRGARLEHIQQAKDFLEAVRYKAAKEEVSIEGFEVFTSDVLQSINTCAQQLECDGMILVVRGGEGLLLSTNEVEQLIGSGARTLYLIRLPSKRHKSWFSMLLEQLSSWLSRHWGRGSGQLPTQQVSQEEGQSEGVLSSSAGLH